MAPLMSEEEVELVRRLAELIGAANGMDWDGQVELQSGRRVGVRLLDVGLVLLSLRPSTVGDGGPGTLRVTRSSPQLLPPPPSPKTHASSTPILLSSPTPSPLTWFPDAYSKTIMGPLILAFPWHTTPLGPFTSWPLCLVQTLGTMLASPFREYLAWGEDFWFAYNDAYLAAAVTKHPVILGNKAETAFAEAWDIIRPPMRRAMQGETQLILNAPVPLERRGILEETYHTYSYTPVRDETGKIRGLLNRSFETTQEFVAQRRLSTVRNLVEKTHQARTVSDFCETVINCIEQNPFDIPFAMLFTTSVAEAKPRRRRDRLAPTDIEEPPTIVNLTLKASVGLPPNHSLLVPEASVDLNSYNLSSGRSDSTGQSTSPYFSWPCEEALTTGEPVVISGPEIAILCSSLAGRAWGDNPREAVVLPIQTEAGDSSAAPQALLIVGLNPRITYSELYKSFTMIVARHLGIGLLAVSNAEAERTPNALLISSPSIAPRRASFRIHPTSSGRPLRSYLAHWKTYLRVRMNCRLR